MTEEDLSLIEQHPVDYLSFSYYMSAVHSRNPELEKSHGNFLVEQKSVFKRKRMGMGNRSCRFENSVK